MLMQHVFLQANNYSTNRFVVRRSLFQQSSFPSEVNCYKALIRRNGTRSTLDKAAISAYSSEIDAAAIMASSSGHETPPCPSGTKSRHPAPTSPPPTYPAADSRRHPRRLPAQEWLCFAESLASTP